MPVTPFPKALGRRDRAIEELVRLLARQAAAEYVAGVGQAAARETVPGRR